MTIQLKPEQERVVVQPIQAGLIQAADDVVAAGVEAIRQRLHAGTSLGSAPGDEAWARDLHEWIHSHKSTVPPLTEEDMSRDSIYGTRGACRWPSCWTAMSFCGWQAPITRTVLSLNGH